MARAAFWLLSLCHALPAVTCSRTLHVRAQATAIVHGPEITIGDVAEVKGTPPEWVARIRRLVVAQSPPPGQERTLHGAYLATRLKQQGVSRQNLKLQAPAKIRVTRAAQRLEPRDIEAAVRHAIFARMPWEPTRTRIQTLRGIEAVTVSTGKVETQVVFPLNTDFLGPTSFTVVFRVSGNVEKRLYGTAYLEVSQDVVTTARPLARHHVITADDIRLTRVNLSRMPRRVLMQPQDVLGKRTRRPLQTHAMIHTYDVELMPVVRKGDVIRILVESPLLKVSTLGEALESGQRGDTIRVKNAASQRELRAIVVDKKTVRVPF